MTSANSGSRRQLGRIGVGVELHRAPLAEDIELEPGVAHALDVLGVGVEHHHPAHMAAHQRGGDTADGAAADHEDVEVDHQSSRAVKRCGGKRSSSWAKAA